MNPLVSASTSRGVEAKSKPLTKTTRIKVKPSLADLAKHLTEAVRAQGGEIFDITSQAILYTGSVVLEYQGDAETTKPTEFFEYKILLKSGVTLEVRKFRDSVTQKIMYGVRWFR